MNSGSDTGEHQPLGQHTSPWYTVPSRSIICVEHPFIIKDVDKGLQTFGNGKSIEQLVNTNEDGRPIEVYLRPDDPMCRPLLSENLKTNNILLKITVPKMVGRKRKREPSNESDADLAAIQSKAPDRAPLKGGEAGCLKRSMRDNVGRYKVEPIGKINYTHRFRDLSDFQYATVNSNFMKKMRDCVLDYDYEKLKGFKFDPSKGPTQNTDLIPPPYFARTHVPFNYNYRQNPAVRYTVDNAGRPIVVNDQAPPKISTLIVSSDADVIPSGPPNDLPNPATLDHGIRDTIIQLTKLMEERPLWTRRALLNRFTNPDYQYTLKHSIQYVGYMFRSGPWRDTIVRFGIDPRSDPKYRFYQSISFQIYDRHDERLKYQRHLKGKRRNLQSHIFDGRHVELDGKVWQKWDGWYTNGLWAKVKTIMRAKIRAIIREGRIPSDVEFAEVLKMPDEFDDTSRTHAHLSSNAMHKDLQLGSQARAMIAQRGGGVYPATGCDVQHIIGSNEGNNIGSETSKDSQGEDGEHIEDARVAEMMLELKRIGGEDDAQFDDEEEEEEDFDFDEEDDESN
ncbi:hypothetical protein FGG08_000070 [Glutinoglossum americanum]|uniref:Uncharacterized protein n=1 Tax=Glutinoglossum americanum TaxID=1670608 RepID=A0A9P8IA03_9PEZI|nr:hypothetical protein FGG08_000070 [Glutinoglossum americanum]